MTAGQRWSKDRPTVQGWYWRRGKGDMYGVGHITEIVRIVLSPAGFPNMEQMGSGQYSPRYHDEENEWQGPITPHDQEA